jgi:hypothetical protein
VIVVLPVVMPVTPPVPLTDAIALLLLLQVPPLAVSINTIVDPTHTEDGPEIVEILGLTVTTAVEIQPGPALYVIVAVPDALPVTIPVALPTDATTP